MRNTRLITFLAAACVFLIALLTGPPSFDATDGAEFAVCGSQLQIAHAPGYPLFLLFVRLFSMVLSPVYGHLLLLNNLLAAAAITIGTAAFRKSGARYLPALAGSLLFLTSSPVLSQFNSLEIYPLAIILVLSAIALKDTPLSHYASGMALFGGHPIALLSSSMFLSFKRKWPLFFTFLIPATLFLYIPIRSGASRIAHYGHPHTLGRLFDYFTMYSGRLTGPSLERIIRAIGFIGIPALAVFLILAAFGGRFNAKRDLPIIAALLFLASYELPDPAGQLWILLLPLSLRCSCGIQFLMNRTFIYKTLALMLLLTAITAGIVNSDRTSDDIAMRWTTDVMTALQVNSIYRPYAHDVFYAAYAQSILGLRKDVLLSDPYRNFFEFVPQEPVLPVIGGRTVHLSRGWNRSEDFSLQGLIFSPVSDLHHLSALSQMAIFEFDGHSPDPMAMDVVAEAWARRMIQTEDPILKDSFYLRAIEFSATLTTRRRIENIREIF